jgi:hypothetical protein
MLGCARHGMRRSSGHYLERRLRYRFESPLRRPYIIMSGLSDRLLTRENMNVLAGRRGRIAQKAGVKTLVLSHLTPAIDSIDDKTWRTPVAKYFKGEIIVGKDRIVM